MRPYVPGEHLYDSLQRRPPHPGRLVPQQRHQLLRESGHGLHGSPALRPAAHYKFEDTANFLCKNLSLKQISARSS